MKKYNVKIKDLDTGITFHWTVENDNESTLEAKKEIRHDIANLRGHYKALKIEEV